MAHRTDTATDQPSRRKILDGAMSLALALPGLANYAGTRAATRESRERICQIHIKDKVYLGSGDVNVRACATHDIGYTGWCVFETAAPSGDTVSGAGKNLKLFRAMERSLNRS